MKALSIQQPWAWLICAGHKDVENRNWPTKFRGRIYIHAGQQADIDAWTHIEDFPGNYPNHEAWIDMFYKTPQELLDMMGCIIGEVAIVDCVTTSRSPWFAGPYAFVLVNPALYEKPIPCKGRLGFFQPDIP